MKSQKSASYLKKCRERVEASQKWRKREGFDALWDRLIDLYAGKHFNYDAMSDEDRIAVNIAFSSINVIFPSVSVNNPKFTLTANHPDNADQCVIAEAVLNYEWRHWKYNPEARLAVKDFCIIGHGWVKTGYRYTEKTQPRPLQDVQAEQQQAYAQVNDLVAQDPSVAGLVPSDEEINAGIPDTHVVVTEDRSFLERVSPHDIFADQTATGVAELRWITQRLIVPLSTAKNDTRYKASVRSQLRGTSTAASSEDSSTKRFSSEDTGEQFTTIWEYYDLVNNTMCVFSDGCKDDFLIEPMSMPYSFGHPFKMLRNYDVPDQFYPMGDLEQIEQLQYELNLTRSALMNDRKRFRRKHLYREQNFDDKGLEALESTEENVMVPVKGTEPFNEVIAAMPTNQPLSDLYNQSDIIKGDMREILALSEYQTGVLPSIRRTATEASVIADASNSRAADKLTVIEAWLAGLGENIIRLAQQYMTGEKVAHIVGKGGDQLWVHYDRSYIEGDFDFAVEAGSTQPNNESFRRQSAMQLMDAMSQFVPTGVINLPELIKFVLQDGFGVKNPEKFLAPPPPPMAPPGGPVGPDGQPLPPDPNAPPGGLPPMPLAPNGTGAPSSGAPAPTPADFANQFVSIGGQPQ